MTQTRKNLFTSRLVSLKGSMTFILGRIIQLSLIVTTLVMGVYTTFIREIRVNTDHIYYLTVFPQITNQDFHSTISSPSILNTDQGQCGDSGVTMDLCQHLRRTNDLIPSYFGSAFLLGIRSLANFETFENYFLESYLFAISIVLLLTILAIIQIRNRKLLLGSFLALVLNLYILLGYVLPGPDIPSISQESLNKTSPALFPFFEFYKFFVTDIDQSFFNFQPRAFAIILCTIGLVIRAEQKKILGLWVFLLGFSMNSTMGLILLILLLGTELILAFCGEGLNLKTLIVILIIPIIFVPKDYRIVFIVFAIFYFFVFKFLSNSRNLVTERSVLYLFCLMTISLTLMVLSILAKNIAPSSFTLNGSPPQRVFASLQLVFLISLFSLMIEFITRILRRLSFGQSINRLYFITLMLFVAVFSSQSISISEYFLGPQFSLSQKKLEISDRLKLESDSWLKSPTDTLKPFQGDMSNYGYIYLPILIDYLDGGRAFKRWPDS